MSNVLRWGRKLVARTRLYGGSPPTVFRFAESARIGGAALGYRFPDLYRFAGEQIGETDRRIVADHLRSLLADGVGDWRLMWFWGDTQTYIVKPPHTRAFTRQVLELLDNHQPPGPPPYG